ncbi:tail fiber assembly protein [Erwinia sp. Eh17-17]|uniref:tail fiber assembly protein n=1 Tax=Erwinia sp. Eh17-17 TaxID=3080330 RepID=UPI0032098295
MKMKYAYSPSQNVFLMIQWKEDYISAGSWPDDVIDVSDEVFNEFTSSVKGKVCVAGQDNLPAWSDAPAMSQEEMVTTAKATVQALKNEATAVIEPLKDALDGGYIDEADMPRLTAWQKYRYDLTKVDISSLPVDFPTKPDRS